LGISRPVGSYTILTQSVATFGRLFALLLKRYASWDREPSEYIYALRKQSKGSKIPEHITATPDVPLAVSEFSTIGTLSISARSVSCLALWAARSRILSHGRFGSRTRGKKAASPHLLKTADEARPLQDKAGERERPDASPAQAPTSSWGQYLRHRPWLVAIAFAALLGGTAADAFDVIIPSLPGFGFSDKPTERGWNV
jgi:hypothetical protein